MLQTLTVWNFALLEHVQVEFDGGLNILTGETGAGKSILIDSLGAVLGHRIAADSIRTGCDWLRVEAVFSLEHQDRLVEFLSEHAVEAEEDSLIITRQLTRNGRSSILVNGCHVTLALLRKIGAFLVDIHGQNENLALLKEASQYALLDRSDEGIAAALEEYRAVYEAWTSRKQELAQREEDSRQYAQRLDMLQWQNREIEEARLKEHEDEELEAEIRRLSHAEKIAEHVEESHRLLESSSREGQGVLAALSQVRKHLQDMSRFDNALANSAKIVEEAFVSLQEAAYEIRDYGESMEFDPRKLDKLQARMDAICKLRKKYGATVSDILEYQEKIQKELADIENYDENIAALQGEIRKEEERLGVCAKKLTEARKKGAKVLSSGIEAQLRELGMPEARFRVEISPLDHFAAHGADDVAMAFSANPGEEAKPLAKVASGGELSRIALAIKTVSAARDDAIPSMVFDEIDTGIGGRTAQMVAERIALVAACKQVLCVTHLPQIACMADVHLYISKYSAGNKTETKIRPLTEAEAVSEIARMASGADATAASLDNAREMVLHARMRKDALRKSAGACGSQRTGQQMT